MYVIHSGVQKWVMLIYGIEKKSKHGNNSFRIKKKRKKEKNKSKNTNYEGYYKTSSSNIYVYYISAI